MKEPRLTDADDAPDPAAPPPREAPPLTLDASLMELLGGVVDGLVDVERAMAGFAAVRARLVHAALQAAGLTHLQAGDRSRLDDLAFRTLKAELAAALRMSERAVEHLIVTSDELVTELPEALAALQRGELSYRHAQILVGHARTLGGDAEARGELERQAVAWGKKLNPPRFERKVRELRERLHSEPLEHRHRRAAEERSVDFEPGRDGMGWLNAYVPAVEAVAIHERLNDEARRAVRQPGETRTRTQLRADIFCKLLLRPDAEDAGGAPEGSGADGDGGSSEPGRRFAGFRPVVFVDVPVLSLLGLSEEPATLDGYGPIDPQTARELAAEAPSFVRILTHPETSARLSVGRDRYAVPADMRAFLRVRDRRCRHVNCNRDARGCDADHGIDWQHGGRTDVWNLANMCRGHHILKHSGGWSVTHLRDGTLIWRSALGREYIDEPEHRFLLPHTG